MTEEEEEEAACTGEQDSQNLEQHRRVAAALLQDYQQEPYEDMVETKKLSSRLIVNCSCLANEEARLHENCKSLVYTRMHGATGWSAPIGLDQAMNIEL
eukprot:s5_g48.t1